MNDVLLGFLLIVVLAIVHVGSSKPTRRIAYGGCSFNVEVDVTETLEVEECLDEESKDLLCSKIFETFNGDYGDKRERLVELLVELSDVEDTSWFMDEHPHIREFIFDCG